MSTVKTGVFWAGVVSGVILGLILMHPAVQAQQPPTLRMWGRAGR